MRLHSTRRPLRNKRNLSSTRWACQGSALPLCLAPMTTVMAKVGRVEEDLGESGGGHLRAGRHWKDEDCSGEGGGSPLAGREGLTGEPARRLRPAGPADVVGR